ncbi:BTB/POZ and MATH domain-containing protein 2 [Panicum miliaceum]|uniref:BTB/POZ and MATH domain-containing protein 2 n=1 Tax=Panicum miliaceum TaxID=4540 RepID=A0A3L6RNL3_PANMI|nr:BTB/POZ and MATH domain-containing protein 2 [Panicum miliaceum]
MREGRTQLVAIEDMQPAVFKALLRFIYTDSLLDDDDLGGDVHIEMIRHLAVAADNTAREMGICPSPYEQPGINEGYGAFPFACIQQELNFLSSRPFTHEDRCLKPRQCIR